MNGIEKAKEAFDVFMNGKVSNEVMELSRILADEYTVFELAFPQATGFLSGYLSALSALEAEKSTEEANKCAASLWDIQYPFTSHGWVSTASRLIQSFAESSHAKKCAECKKNTEVQPIEVPAADDFPCDKCKANDVCKFDNYELECNGLYFKPLPEAPK